MMFRYIWAWLQALFGYVKVWLLDARDSAWLGAAPAMEEEPVTVSLGPIGPLFQQLRSVIASLQGNSRRLKLKGVKAQIQILGQELEGFCIDLKGRSEAPADAMTMCWMRQVRDLCYDTADYLDELMRFIHYSGTRRRLFGRNRLLRSKTFRVSRRLTCLSLPKLKKMRRAPLIVKLSALVARVEDADESRQRFKLSPPTSSKPDYAQAVAFMPQTPPQLHIDKLNELLALDGNEMEKNLKVVAIFGSAGVGKTAIARALYHQHRGRFQHRAFIRVSRDPDMRRLLADMLSQIKAPLPHAFSDVQGLIAHITKHLQGKRYLIIIDDLWSTSTWDIIIRALPAGDYCRIITTTEVEDVALACCSYELKHIYQITPLNDDQSGKSEGGCTTYPTSEGMKEALNLVYNNLPPRLKTCLLYLNMYPEGCTLRKDELVKQWVAEDFISSVQGQDIEDTAGCYFDTLVSSGLIQSVDTNHNGEMLSCTLHHMVLDLIRQKSMEENFVTIVNYFQTILGLPDKVRRLSVQLGGAKGANNIPENMRISQVRSLLFSGFFKRAPSIVHYGLLQVLVLHIWSDKDEIFDLATIGELYRLRYLKIECNITVKLPGKIQRLRHLGTLQVDSRLHTVPSGIVLLEKLLHLRLPSESILPHGVGRMTCLRTLGYFDLGRNSEDNVRDLGELKNLRDLQLTCSTAQPAESLQNNMQLLGTVLKKLSILRSVTLVPTTEFNVNTLQGDFGVSKMCIPCDGFSSMSAAPVHLQTVELSRHCCIFSSLPRCLGELAKLRILKIAVGELLKEDIDILKGVPSLTALSLHLQTMSAERIVFGKGGFSVLTYFKFTCTEKPWLKLEDDAMPNLEKLKLCFNSPIVDEQGATPIIIEHLSSGIIEISAKICCASVDARSALMKAIRNDPKNPEVQLMVSMYYDEEGRGMVTREGSVEDESNETHSRNHMPPESSCLPVPEVPLREDKLEDIISIPRGSESTDGHTGQIKIHSLPRMEDQSVLQRILNGDQEPTALPFSLLEQITDSFSEERKIGQGGYGVVYKGVYNGEELAVKLFYNLPALGNKQFENECVNLLRIRHPNIVRLLGYCYETQHTHVEYNGELRFAQYISRILCFEYLQGGSLDKYLNEESCDHDWPTRYNIIEGTCEGLNFLHGGCGSQILHLDLKPANILLDKYMGAKVADFGLSRFFSDTPIGTKDYMSPEFKSENVTTSKNDVYSLGIIIIKIMAGRRDYLKLWEMDDATEFIQLVITDWRERINATISPFPSAELDQVETCIKIAIKCVDPNRKNRPTVAQILDTIQETEKRFLEEWRNHAGFLVGQSLPAPTKSEPRGGSGGTARDIKEDPWRLHSLTISYQGLINAFSFSYIDQSGKKQCVGPWGEECSYHNTETIRFSPSEFVEEVSGGYGSHFENIIVTSLTFVTNIRTYGPFGNSHHQSVAVTPFRFMADEGSSIVAFHGRSGSHLFSIGVYMYPSKKTTLRTLSAAVIPKGQTTTYSTGLNLISSSSEQDCLPRMGDETLLERILNGEEDPKDLPLALLQKITDNFSEDRIIGQGGFRVVYKGVLWNGIIVAVKRFNVHTIDDKLFRREFNSLRKINHQNLVRFLGFCSNTYQLPIEEAGREEINLASVRERLLCFEYISNGSLDKHITDELRGLEWETRYEIIIGICKGLCYLHEEKKIVHMDLKPGNILLDDHMVPKITNFGLSRPNENSHTMDQCFGTRGYFAPEYETFGKTSFKCDIYGLGVIIVELVTGCKGAPDKDDVLERWKCRESNPPMTLLQYQQVTSCIEIAVRCREQEPKDRPPVRDIISILSVSESRDGTAGQIS